MPTPAKSKARRNSISRAYSRREKFLVGGIRSIRNLKFNMSNKAKLTLSLSVSLTHTHTQRESVYMYTRSSSTKGIPTGAAAARCYCFRRDRESDNKRKGTRSITLVIVNVQAAHTTYTVVHHNIDLHDDDVPFAIRRAERRGISTKRAINSFALYTNTRTCPPLCLLEPRDLHFFFYL